MFTSKFFKLALEITFLLNKCFLKSNLKSFFEKKNKLRGTLIRDPTVTLKYYFGKLIFILKQPDT